MFDGRSLNCRKKRIAAFRILQFRPISQFAGPLPAYFNLADVGSGVFTVKTGCFHHHFRTVELRLIQDVRRTTANCGTQCDSCQKEKIFHSDNNIKTKLQFIAK